MNEMIVAKVEDIMITRQRLAQTIQTLPPQQKKEMDTFEGRKKLLEEMVAGELFYLEAKENNLEDTDEFNKIMEEAKHNLLQRYAIQKLLETIQVEEKEIQDYYDQNKKSFVSQEQMNAKHILIRDEATAKDVLEKIKQGLVFEEAAKQYSTCPSKESGGDLGYFSKGRMVPEFEKAAFSLKVGEISDLVKTQFGYHIILVVDHKYPEIQSYDKVKESIRQQIVTQKQTNVYRAKVDELRNNYTVETNDEALR